MENNTRNIVIKKVKEFIQEKGLEIKNVEENESGSVTISITEPKIRQIGLKPFLDYMGVQQSIVKWEYVEFVPEADLYSFNGQIVSQDPTTKEEDVKAGLIAEAFGGLISEEEIEVKQDDTQGLDGLSVFNFTVTSNRQSGVASESAYLEFALPPGTKTSVLLNDFANEIEDLSGNNNFISDEKAEEVLDNVGEVFDAVALNEEDLREMSELEFSALKTKLKDALEMAEKFNIEILASSIRASLVIINKIENER